MEKKHLLVGAHVSISQGVHNALLEGKEIGANIIQMFTANQRQWAAKKIAKEETDLWEKTRKETGISHIMSHGSYLINLGSSDKELYEKSKKAFQEEIERCHLLKIDYLNFHPGASLGGTEEECLERVCKALLTFDVKAPLKLLIESTAGQGSSVGYKFEHLGYILDYLKNKLPIGICIDTCHCFAAGYDIRTEEGWDNTLKEFDEKIGLQHLCAFHVNDSACDLGSKKDRHAQIGDGKIGLSSFKYLMTNPKTKYLPKYLETPDPKLFKDEIKLLKKFGGE